ncbi:MAG: ATP-dependent helicase Lhr and Lhr-like helicase, partial [Verrucomicrobiota bacterium]
TFVGTVNEDFAVESLAGDIFQLGNASWRILRVNSGVVRVEDAKGQPPGLPFWLGDAPARTSELSQAVSAFRNEIEHLLGDGKNVCDWLVIEMRLPPEAAQQIADYFADTYRALGAIPSQKTLVMERFFDESGGMQLVLHSPFGNRINRAWGLALRKRFCRSFNFELQAAATDDSIVISLGTQHSFPLDEVFRYLNAKTVRDLLIQALLDAPMFTIRWRWNATRSLAVPRFRGGSKLAAPLQRMESENLLAAVFPDQLACLEHIVGDREIPNHPLVKQTIDDCLTEAMDIDGLEEVLRKIDHGEIRCIARDLPEPSPMASEILNARPYAFLDNAPLEERRTQAVYTRRASERNGSDGLGILDSAAIDKVQHEAWPEATNADELHDALMLLTVMTRDEVQRTVHHEANGAGVEQLLNELVTARRATELRVGEERFWVTAERLPMLQIIYPDSGLEPELVAPESARRESWERSNAIRELLRGRMEVSGPITVGELENILSLPRTEIDGALLALEGEGFVLRGKFHADAAEQEWCDRRLLARIHRLTIDRLRAEIQPVSAQDFFRFLFAWQRLDAEHRVEGPEGLQSVLEQLDGCELPLASWESAVLSARVSDYDPEWLDRLCFSGRVGWARLSSPQHPNARATAPLRTSPMALYQRENLDDWVCLAPGRSTTEPAGAERRGRESPRGFASGDASKSIELSVAARSVRDALAAGGALFFPELVRRTGLLPSQVEEALSELAALGFVTSDSFDGLRALLVPSNKRPTFGRNEGKRRRKTNLASIEFAGRWSLIRKEPTLESNGAGLAHRDAAVEKFARVLLRRYGVVFRRLLERESLAVTWYELGRIYRRWEARGEIRGGYFVAGVSGEQFALPEAIGLLRSIRKTASSN